MKPSTAWSLLAFSLASASYAMNRDISSNVFLACVFVIQGVRAVDGSKQEKRASFLAAALSVGIMLFAASAMAGCIELSGPEPFRFRD